MVDVRYWHKADFVVLDVSANDPKQTFWLRLGQMCAYSYCGQ